MRRTNRIIPILMALLGIAIPTGVVALLNWPFPAMGQKAWAGDDSKKEMVQAPEFWIFGLEAKPQRAIPLGGQGIRGILDLRTLSADAAINMMGQYADLGEGMAITLRWKVPHDKDERLTGAANFDVPPTPSESARALDLLEQILTSPEAQRLSDHLYIQFYNEVGGGPGRFTKDQLPAMLEFASQATKLIREKAPFARICGPAFTMGQILNQELADDPDFADQAEVIQKSIEWTAQNADAIDLHMHGTDGTYAKQALHELREMLREVPGGDDLEIVAWEWSPARFRPRDDTEAVRNAILGLWQAMAEGGVSHAAYGSYWATAERREAGVAELYLWKSIVSEDGMPREPVFSTLQDIGMGRIAIRQPEDDDNDHEGDDDALDDFDTDDNSSSSVSRIVASDTSLWINGLPRDIETAERLGAAGVHDMIDLRTASNGDLTDAIKKCRKTDLGVVLTVRWSDPDDEDAFDEPPDARRMNQMITKLRNTLKSKDAKTVGENELWVQFFDEVAGEHGRIKPEDAEAMFAFATEMVAKIRATAPHVRISGPALTSTSLLTKSNLTPDEQGRFGLLTRAVDWSIENADAIDIHLDESEGEPSAAIVQRVRSFIDARSNGKSLALVSWDWNAGSMSSTTASNSDARDDMIREWDELEKAGLRHAAYGPFMEGDDDDPSDDRFALVDSDENDRDEIASAFSEIAEAEGQLIPNDQQSDPAESEAQRKKRMNAFKNDYKNILKGEFRASGDKDWKKQWSVAWKANWEAAWEEHERQRVASPIQ